MHCILLDMIKPGFGWRSHWRSLTWPLSAGGTCWPGRASRQSGSRYHRGESSSPRACSPPADLRHCFLIRKILDYNTAANSLSTLTVRVEGLLDFPESEGQLPHPVHAAPHAPCGQVHLGGGRRRPEAVSVEVVAGEILTVVITRHVVNVNLSESRYGQ